MALVRGTRIAYNQEQSPIRKHGIARTGWEADPMSVESREQKGAASGEVQTVSPPTDDELDQELARLRDDISHGGRVPEAREAVKELEARWPDDPRVQYWARVLAPPRVVPTPEAHLHRRPLDRERAWLKQHARDYPGCWLAVYEDRLIAADPDLSVVYAEVRRVLGTEGALLHWQPGGPKHSGWVC
jgi:hypothetical protein